ncbi:response regulator [Amycolatopsis sp. DSM 110486]|nr:response regulator [Amycolatopsis sp. DSM 110486]
MVVVEAFVSIGRLRDGVALIDRVEKLWNKAHAEDARRDDPATDSQERDPRSLVVLAVDDEPHGLDELVHGLRANPCVGEVLCAADAADALRLLARTNSPSPGQQAGSRPRVDAVFADIAMPGLSGIEMSRMIAAVNLVPSVVFVTAYADKAVDAFELGEVDYLLKPYRQSRLDDAIARVLGRQRARQEDR